MVSSSGKGALTCQRVGIYASLTRCEASYPLRFLTASRPFPTTPTSISVYLLTFGGGCVSGDSIDIDILVQSGCALSLLSQASLKVYKQRNDSIQSYGNLSLRGNRGVRQSMRARVENDALLAVLPEPVTCYSNAAFSQTQNIILEPNASLVMLDWFTCGRMSRGEEWQFDSCTSTNTIVLEGYGTVVRDSWKLVDDGYINDGEPSSSGNTVSVSSSGHRYGTNPDGHDDTTTLTNQLPHIPKRKSYASRVLPYKCLANIVLLGPQTRSMTSHILSSFEKISISHNRKSPNDNGVIWSASPLLDGVGCIVRAAALDTSTMRCLLVGLLSAGLEEQGVEWGTTTFGSQVV
ncbi:hypothetical protein SeLEV6574_g05732 [Synchytrium endobioticum]|uniref:Urease accessory protein UreD n=1 Tax=Synchytrium endobioticum TaxID=286115 RepID=A0A507CST6_9FUNG|nr:hypothetical protein SeLEV6574_g05732 [Synchytrium endobioticum]